MSKQTADQPFVPGAAANPETPVASDIDPETIPPLVPARMLNEFAYCPRLAYQEWVQGEFTHSADTLDGTFRHRRVDRPGGGIPDAPGAKEGTGEAPGPDKAANDKKVPGRARAKSPARIDEDDSPGTELKAGESDDTPIHARSVELSAPILGMIAVLDLIEGEGSAPESPLTPVDYKRGAVPDLPERAWEPDRVQLCAQGLILQENGYRTDGGVIYYVASKTRVPVLFDEALRARTLELLAQFRQVAASDRVPPPLQGSPKCPRCSLAPICLPDEVNLLAELGESVVLGMADAGMADDGFVDPGDELKGGAGSAISTPVAAPTMHGSAHNRVRRIVPARADTRPLYVQEQGASIGRRGETLQVRAPLGITLAEMRLVELSHVCVFGNVQVTTQALGELFDRGVPVAFFSSGGWFRGFALGLPGKNIELRRRQYAAAADPAVCLALARRFTAAKVANQRTLLRRNVASLPAGLLDGMKRAAVDALAAEGLPGLLGLEGNGARLYFSAFAGMLKPKPDRPGMPAVGMKFDFSTRNRRPPRDPVNALLSYAYALLAKDLTVACWLAGLDPFLGFYHQPRFGRPALALDLMEEFRPIVADSVVLTAINTGVVGAGDFLRRGPAVALMPQGRKRFIQCYERRMDSLVTHPVFKYQLSYRRVLEVQVKLLGRVLAGELPVYPPFVVR